MAELVSATLLRPIVGFHTDEHGDWVAELRCGHNQHVRHHPPFWSRPWVLTEAGRAEKLGAPLPCVLCERFELPAGVVAYKRTPEFTAETIPAALQSNHSTKAGVWGLLHVTRGRLRYVVEPPLARDEIVDTTRPGVIVPEIVHRVVPEGDVCFFVEFHRRSVDSR
jgi:tellurite methyltransferase